MLRLVARLPQTDYAAIHGDISEETRDVVEHAPLLAWVHMAHNVEVTRAISLQLGPAGTRAFYRSFLGVVYESPLMRNFMQAALRISQRDVGLGLRLMPRGYDLIFRNVGTWMPLEIHGNAAELSLRGLPAICMERELWLDSVAGSLESVFDLGGREGTVDIVRLEAATGRVDFRLQWSASA